MYRRPAAHPSPSRPGRTSADDEALSLAIADAMRVEAMPYDLADRLLARLDAAATTRPRPARGPSPWLWLVPVALSGACAVLLAAALALGLPLAAAVTALSAGLAAAALVVADLARLVLVPGSLVAAAVSALLFPRVARMEVRER